MSLSCERLRRILLVSLTAGKLLRLSLTPALTSAMYHVVMPPSAAAAAAAAVVWQQRAAAVKVSSCLMPAHDPLRSTS